MSPARRRRRRVRGSGEGSGEQSAEAKAASPALPEWNWRTMPVFIALSAGLFLGLLLGSGAVAGGSTVSTVIFLVVAGMLGISVSRMVMRLLMRRGIIKPQPRRR